jgi:hypothetical protein
MAKLPTGVWPRLENSVAAPAWSVCIRMLQTTIGRINILGFIERFCYGTDASTPSGGPETDCADTNEARFCSRRRTTTLATRHFNFSFRVAVPSGRSDPVAVFIHS